MVCCGCGLLFVVVSFDVWCLLSRWSLFVVCCSLVVACRWTLIAVVRYCSLSWLLWLVVCCCFSLLCVRCSLFVVRCTSLFAACCSFVLPLLLFVVCCLLWFVCYVLFVVCLPCFLLCVVWCLLWFVGCCLLPVGGCSFCVLRFVARCSLLVV